ncbi:basic amino acid ABC transporter substrate-binding protein [Spirochaetia bacterium]|nr:basic amino acid ABC transporter substrate-binding protein [Spirochaetia bacterium]
MKKVCILLILAIAITFAGCKAKQSGLTMEKGVLTIGMEIGYPPLEYYNDRGEIAGFDVEMGKALAAKLGLTPKFVDTAWDGIFAGVSTNRYDCIMSAVTINPERQAAHNFTKPYVGNALAIVLLKGSGKKPQGFMDLTGLGVAYQAETTSDIVMTRQAALGLKFTPYEYEKVTSCFDELALKRVDAIVTDSLVALDYTVSDDSPFEIVWQGEADEFFGICLKKGNDELTAALNKALDELFEEGTLQKISLDILKIDMVTPARNSF